MPIIKKLKNFFTREIVYPVTMEKAVYDENGLRLDAKMPFRFGIDADGNYGYYKDGADTVTPFRPYGMYIKKVRFDEITSTKMTIETPLKSIEQFIISPMEGFSEENFLLGDDIRRIMDGYFTYLDDNTFNLAEFHYSHPTTAGSYGSAVYTHNLADKIKEIHPDGGKMVMSDRLNGVITHFAKDCTYNLIFIGKE